MPLAPTDGGTPLVTTGTFGSVVLGVLSFYLPWLLAHAGIPVASQVPFVALVNQVGPPLFALATLFFRFFATQKVTSVLPSKKVSKTALHLLLIFPLLVIVGAGTLGLAACASLSSNSQIGLTISEIAGETTFVAVADGVKTFDALPTTTPAQAAIANGDACKGWALLGQVRTDFGLGETFLPILIELSDLQAQVAGDTAGKVTMPGARRMAALHAKRLSLSGGDISLAITILQDIITVGNALVADLPQLISTIEAAISAATGGNLTGLQAQQARIQAIANGLQPTGC